MSNENMGPSGIPQDHPALRRLIKSISLPEDKRRSGNARIFRNHDDAYMTRTIQRCYRAKGAAKETKYTISMLRLDGVWYIRLLSSLARLIGYKGGEELRKDKPDAVYTFKTVAYGNDSSYSKPPPPNSNVHDTSFLKYDQYMKWLLKTKEGVAFLPFITGAFRVLRSQRNFVPHYSTIQPLLNLKDFEETLDTEILPDPVVSATETISNEPSALISFKDRLDKKLRSIQEQEEHITTDENTNLLEEVKTLRSRIAELVPFRDGLADAFLMSEESEREKKAKSQYIKALMSVAAEDRAASGE